MALGQKTGGRRKGSHNKTTAERRAKIADSGLTPLDYMLKILRDTRMPDELRFDAAKAAAAYVHPKLAAVQHSGTIGVRDLTDISDDELAAIARGSSEGASQKA